MYPYCSSGFHPGNKTRVSSTLIFLNSPKVSLFSLLWILTPGEERVQYPLLDPPYYCFHFILFYFPSPRTFYPVSSGQNTHSVCSCNLPTLLSHIWTSDFEAQKQKLTFYFCSLQSGNRFSISSWLNGGGSWVNWEYMKMTVAVDISKHYLATWG